MNNLTSYQTMSPLLEELEKLEQDFNFKNEEDKVKFYKKNSYLFAFISSNLFRLLPQVPYSKHKSILKKLLYNLRLLTIEEKYVDEFIQNLEIIDIENTLNKAQKGQPFIFCCFHTGAYSIIPALLANKSLNFGFLCNKALTEKKGKDFLEMHQKYCEKYKINSTIELINVEENKGIWKALRILKEGKSLIVYTDGNTGSNYSKNKSQNTVRVNFLGENLQVRQGIAFLSYMCGVPIVPVLSSREENISEKFSLKRKYILLPTIYPPTFKKEKTVKNQISKEEFALQTMQQMYSILEKEITDNLEQTGKWEGWIFVSKFFETPKKTLYLNNQSMRNNIDDKLSVLTNQLYVFNEERFTLIENKKNTLLDKFTYRFFSVSDLLYEIINHFSVPKKLYLSNELHEKTEIDSHSPITSIPSPNGSIPSNFKLQISQFSVSVSAIEKLIQKNILIKYY